MLLVAQPYVAWPDVHMYGSPKEQRSLLSHIACEQVALQAKRLDEQLDVSQHAVHSFVLFQASCDAAHPPCDWPAEQ